MSGLSLIKRTLCPLLSASVETNRTTPDGVSGNVQCVSASFVCTWPKHRWLSALVDCSRARDECLSGLMLPMSAFAAVNLASHARNRTRCPRRGPEGRCNHPRHAPKHVCVDAARPFDERGGPLLARDLSLHGRMGGQRRRSVWHVGSTPVAEALTWPRARRSRGRARQQPGCGPTQASFVQRKQGLPAPSRGSVPRNLPLEGRADPHPPRGRASVAASRACAVRADRSTPLHHRRPVS